MSPASSARRAVGGQPRTGDDDDEDTLGAPDDCLSVVNTKAERGDEDTLGAPDDCLSVVNTKAERGDEDTLGASDASLVWRRHQSREGRRGYSRRT